MEHQPLMGAMVMQRWWKAVSRALAPANMERHWTQVAMWLTGRGQTCPPPSPERGFSHRAPVVNKLPSPVIGLHHWRMSMVLRMAILEGKTRSMDTVNGPWRARPSEPHRGVMTRRFLRGVKGLLNWAVMSSVPLMVIT